MLLKYVRNFARTKAILAGSNQLAGLFDALDKLLRVRVVLVLEFAVSSQSRIIVTRKLVSELTISYGMSLLSAIFKATANTRLAYFRTSVYIISKLAFDMQATSSVPRL